MAKNDFQYGRWNSYTLQCGTIITLMSCCTSLRNFIQIGPPSAEKNDVISIFKMAELCHLGFYGSSNGFLEKPMYDLYVQVVNRP